MNMLQHFMTPLLVELSASPAEPGSSGAGCQPPQQQGAEQGNLFYKERSTLMASIIKKMMYDLHPPIIAKTKGMPIIPHGLTVRTPSWEIMDGIISAIQCRGWLDLKAIHCLDTLLCVGGAQWLCEALVRHTLSYDNPEEIHRAVDLVFGIFHLDIEHCALALLLHVLPFYLYSDSSRENLAEPRGSALARLTVLTTYAALQSRQSSLTTGRQVGRKGSYREMEIEESWDPNDRSRPSKVRRGVNDIELLEDTPFALQSSSDEHLRTAIANPINKAVADLMRTLMVIASDPMISQRSLFPIYFLEQVVLCAKDQANAILQFMPLGLVGHLIKINPELFTHELVLVVSSMQSPRARKLAARSLCQLAITQKNMGK